MPSLPVKNPETGSPSFSGNSGAVLAFVNSEGVNLYYEETGSGHPLLFLHEFGGDARTWAQQVRYFSRRYRCIVTAAQGYPPSDVPEN